jgi:hypothetical protein
MYLFPSFVFFEKVIYVKLGPLESCSFESVKKLKMEVFPLPDNPSKITL